MNQIKTVRSMRNMTREHLADKIGVSTVSLWNYETGKRNPPGDVIVKMSKELDVSSDVLLGIKKIEIE